MSIARCTTVSSTRARSPSSRYASLSMPANTSLSWSRSTRSVRVMKLRTLEILKFEMSASSAQKTPAFFGTRIVLMPRSFAWIPMCTGPAPPNAISA